MKKIDSVGWNEPLTRRLEFWPTYGIILLCFSIPVFLLAVLGFCEWKWGTANVRLLLTDWPALSAIFLTAMLVLRNSRIALKRKRFFADYRSLIGEVRNRNDTVRPGKEPIKLPTKESVIDKLERTPLGYDLWFVNTILYSFSGLGALFGSSHWMSSDYYVNPEKSTFLWLSVVLVTIPQWYFATALSLNIFLTAAFIDRIGDGEKLPDNVTPLSIDVDQKAPEMRWGLRPFYDLAFESVSGALTIVAVIGLVVWADLRVSGNPLSWHYPVSIALLTILLVFVSLFYYQRPIVSSIERYNRENDMIVIDSYLTPGDFRKFGAKALVVFVIPILINIIGKYIDSII